MAYPWMMQDTLKLKFYVVYKELLINTRTNARLVSKKVQKKWFGIFFSMSDEH